MQSRHSISEWESGKPGKKETKGMRRAYINERTKDKEANGNKWLEFFDMLVSLQIDWHLLATNSTVHSNHRYI